MTVAVTSSKNRGKQKSYQQRNQTVGDFVRRLFSSERDFYGTMLPRLPIQVERDLQVKLLFAEKIQERAKKHLANRKTMDYFKILGSRVMALYGDDDNPITWYEGVVDRVVLREEGSSYELATPKFVVTFPEYGNTETVTLGELEMMGVCLDSTKKALPARDEKRGHENPDRGRGSYDRGGRSDYERNVFSNQGYSGQNDSNRGDRRGYHNGNDNRRENEPRRGYDSTDHHRRGRDNETRTGRGYNGNYKTSQSAGHLPSNDDLYEEVRRRERANAQGKQGGSRRPSNPNANRTDSYRSNRQGSSNYSHRSVDSQYSSNQERDLSLSAPPDTTRASAPKRSAGEVAAQAEKKRKLMAKYG